MEEKEEAINDLADDLAKVRAIVAEKEKKLEELEGRHSKLADYYEKECKQQEVQPGPYQQE